MLWTCLCISMKKKTNFESFGGGQNLVIFQKKTHKNANFCYFFFDPTLFSAGNSQTAKKITWVIPNDQNIYQKNFDDIGTNIDETKSKIWTPLRPLWGGGWNQQLIDFFYVAWNHVFYFVDHNRSGEVVKQNDAKEWGRGSKKSWNNSNIHMILSWWKVLLLSSKLFRAYFWKFWVVDVFFLI